MKKFINHPFIDIFLIFFISLTPLLWFKSNTFMGGHDLVFPLEPAIFLEGRLSTWIEHGFGASQSLIMGTIPIHFIDAIPYFLGFSIQMTQKIVYVFWFFLIGLSAYVLASVLKKESREFKFTAAIMYQFNFFILQAWWIGERTKFSAYIALPLIVAIFIKVLRNDLPVLRALGYLGLIFFIFNGGGIYGISLFGGFLVVISSFLAIFSAFSIYKKEFFRVRKLFILLVLSICLFFLVNTYYFLPAISQVASQYSLGLGKGGGISGFINWAGEISANANYINIFRLQGLSEWYDNPDHPYARFFFSNPLLIVISFIWPLTAVLALKRASEKEDKKIVIFLLVSYLIGIFFAAGTHPPLGFLYKALLEYIPGFIAFRSPYFKFAPSIFFACSFLAAYFISSFKGRSKNVLFFGFIFVLFLYHFPYFTGDFFSWKKGFSTRLEIPAHVASFSEWIRNEKKDDARILMVPPNSPSFEYSAYKWGYLSFQPLPTLFTNDSVVINNDKLTSEEKYLVSKLYASIENRDLTSFLKFSSLLRVKYFILQEDIVIDPLSSLSQDYQLYADILENSFYLSEIKNLGGWRIFSIDNNYTPQIVALSSVSVISGKTEDIEDYYDFSQEHFALYDKNAFTKKSAEYVVPDCLNCRIPTILDVYIPNRTILPESPLYKAVVFNEERKLHRDNRKSLIYDYVGLSLNRAGEVRGMLIHNKGISEEFSNRYSFLFKEIIENFQNLEKYEDKLQVSSDLNYYMVAQRTNLLEFMEKFSDDLNELKAVEQIVVNINRVIQAVEPFSQINDSLSNRIYTFTSNNSGIYDIYVSKNDLETEKNDYKISLRLDKKTQKNIPVNLKSSPEKWIFLSRLNLEKGDHTVDLTFPEPSNLSKEFVVGDEIFNKLFGKNCYVSEVKEMLPKEKYKIVLSYENDFANDLSFYLWETVQGKEELKNTNFLEYNFSTKEFKKILRNDFPFVKGIKIGLCSRKLNPDILQSNISLTVHKLILPKIILVPVSPEKTTQEAVKYKRISPTKYEIALDNKDNSMILAFMERFDAGWLLNGFEKNHFKVDGYANAWVIDKQGRLNLTLEYKPQSVFKIGSIVSGSLVALLLGYTIFCLIYNKKKND